MNFKNNIYLYRFLLPTSVIIMVSGIVLFFLKNMYVAILLLFFGFIFFIASLVDLSITRKRNINNGIQKQNESLTKTNLFWIYSGILIIVGLVFFIGLIMITLSKFHD
jgi:ABC-type branched-subunit amino acid transport system permease subunit